MHFISCKIPRYWILSVEWQNIILEFVKYPHWNERETEGERERWRKGGRGRKRGEREWRERDSVSSGVEFLNNESDRYDLEKEKSSNSWTKALDLE